MEELLRVLLATVNEILTAATVIIAISLLLYNLTRNLRNRVARSSAALLACVTHVYIFDAFISLEPDLTAHILALRLQWIGIALVPAAMVHLSDALLATTGLPSRGRRRRIVRVLYAIGTLFAVGAALTDLVVIPELGTGTIFLRAMPLFWVYVAYFLGANIFAFINVQRARLRCLTRSTQRRMAYLQAAFLTPALGLFPFSAFLFPPGEEASLGVLTLVNIGNLIIVFMLIFLSYPLSFFGSDQPDRVVKVELLRFLLRGPGTGLLALAAIVLTVDTSRILGLMGEDFLVLAVVGLVLLWQWTIALALPWLEKWLVYRDEEDEQFVKLQDLSDRILTRSDLIQLIEATLEATCDSLRVGVAFIFTAHNQQIEPMLTVGAAHFTDEDLQQTAEEILSLLPQESSDDARLFVTWGEYQITPLYSLRANGGRSDPSLIGVFGIQMSAETLAAMPAEDRDMLYAYIERGEAALDDMQLQVEIVAALEGLLPQISTTRTRAGEVEYRPGYEGRTLSTLPAREEVFEQVRAALRHYWGGPGISRSRLQELKIVQAAIEPNGMPVQALRTVLQNAIEKQRPEGERSMTSPEWTIYNILEMRFIEGKKVRDVAKRMSMSEPDLYRKQRLAIEAVADALLEMEEATSSA